MSKFRILTPEQDSTHTAQLIPKLKKALLLCEILQSSSPRRSVGMDDSIFYLKNYPEIFFHGRFPRNENVDQNYFKVFKKSSKN